MGDSPTAASRDLPPPGSAASRQPGALRVPTFAGMTAPSPRPVDPTDDTGPRSDRRRGVLRMPLFYRLLAVNGLVVTLGAVGGTYLAVRLARGSPDLSPLLLVGGLALVGGAASVGLGALLVRWALAPLAELAEAAERVQAGGEPAAERVPVPEGSDPSLTRLVRVFNEMLESLSRYRERLRRLTLRALETAEEERSELAQLLQDDTAQRLASCLLRLRVARSRPDGEARDRALDALRRETTETLESVRRLARSLRPPELDDIGLENALRALARQVEERGGPSFELELRAPDEAEARLTADARVGLYRMVQEAVLNAERHAGADRVRLHVGTDGDRLVAEVEDDGRGFDTAAGMNGGAPALGLLGMDERARFHDGRLDVRSRPGEGTRVRLELPLSPAGRARPRPGPGPAR